MKQKKTYIEPQLSTYIICLSYPLLESSPLVEGETSNSGTGDGEVDPNLGL